MTEFISKSEQDTIAFASQLAGKLQAKDIVVLSGELRLWKNKICTRNFKIFWIRK